MCEKKQMDENVEKSPNEHELPERLQEQTQSIYIETGDYQVGRRRQYCLCIWNAETPTGILSLVLGSTL